MNIRYFLGSIVFVVGLMPDALCAMSAQYRLREAIERNNLDEVRAAIAAGASANDTSDRDFTPLLMAINVGSYVRQNLPIIEELLTHTTEPYINHKEADTTFALKRAAEEGKTDIVKMLIAHHADVNLKNRLGYTALHGAANRGRETAARVLLENGAHADEQDNEGETALMKAARGGHASIARMLINEFGADRDLRNKNGYTAQELARTAGHQAVADLIQTLEGSGPLVKYAGFQGAAAIQE